MPYQDIEITCQCGEKFWWTAGEQNFINKLLEEGKLDTQDEITGEITQGEVVVPKRCPQCRENKKRKYKQKN